MKMLLSLLLLITVPVVVAQTIVDAPLLAKPAIQDLTAEASQDVTESTVPTAAEPESVSHDLCCGQHDGHESAVGSSACSGCAKCCCGSCCHVGGCGDENPCGTGCQGICCNNVILDEHGNIIPSDGAIVDDGGVVPDGSATAIDDGMYASDTSVRGFGGGSGISAFSGGWGIGFGAVGGGGGGGGRRAAAFAAGVGVTRGFRNRQPLSASD